MVRSRSENRAAPPPASLPGHYIPLPPIRPLWNAKPAGIELHTAPPSDPDLNILLPQIRRFENDNRLVINFNTALSGYPMAFSCTYGRGTFSVLAVPDDFADLYRLHQSILNQIG